MRIERNSLIPLSKGNISLRPIMDSDTEDIVRWRNNESVRSNFIFRGEFTAETHTNWLRTKVDTGKVIQYIMEDSLSKRPIGSIYIRDININNKSGEFGIFIGEDSYRKKGFGTEATRLFLPYCFSLGFHRIFLRVLAENMAAVRSYFKVGFKQEGIFRDMEFLDGEYKDIVFMSILENELI